MKIDGPIYIDGIEGSGSYRIKELRRKKRQDRIFFEISIEKLPLETIETIILDTDSRQSMSMKNI